MKLVFALMLAAMAAAATAQETTSQRRQREYPASFALAERAETVPAELRSLALTAIARQPSLRDREWKVELLERAFEAALLAHLKHPVWYVPPKDGTKPPPRILHAHRINRGLDRLTLATAAVTAMIPLDSAKARQLFERIPALETQSFGCKLSLLPNTSIYFKTAAKLPDAQAHAMQRVTSSLQVAAAAAMVSSPELAHQFAGILATLPVESRAWWQTIEPVSEELSKLVARVDPSARVTLLSGWRSYLTRGLRAPQCAEAADPADRWREKVIDTFHKQSGVDQLREHEIKPGETLAACEDAWTEVSEKQRRIGKEGLALLVTVGKSGNDPEWQSRFRKHLDTIEEVRANEVNEDLFAFQSGAFAEAAMAAPEGPLRRLAVARFLDQLKIANVRTEDVSGWYSALSDWVHLMKTMGTPEQQVLETLENSGQALLVVFAQIERLSGQR